MAAKLAYLMKRRASQLSPDQEPEFNAWHLENFAKPEACPVIFYAASQLAERYITVEHVFEFNALFRGLLAYVTCSRSQREKFVGRCQCSRGSRCEAEYFYILTVRYARLRSGLPYSISSSAHRNVARPLELAARLAFRPIFVFDFMYRCGFIGEEMADSLIKLLYPGNDAFADVVLDLLRKRGSRRGVNDLMVHGGWIFNDGRVGLLAAVGQRFPRFSTWQGMLEMAANRHYPHFYIRKALEGVLRAGLDEKAKKLILLWCISHGFTGIEFLVLLERLFRRFSGVSESIVNGDFARAIAVRLDSVKLSPALVRSLMQVGPEWVWPVLREEPLRTKLRALEGKGLIAALGSLHGEYRNWTMYISDILQTYDLTVRKLSHRLSQTIVFVSSVEYSHRGEYADNRPETSLLRAIESWHPELRSAIAVFKLNP